MTAQRNRQNNVVHRRRRRSGSSAWANELERGDDAGLFGPGSAVWAVNGALPTAVAGIRALMMQSLHPAVMAGMYDHSDYHRDPIKRLNRTIRWVATTTFGDTHAAETAAQSINRIHRHVNGFYTDKSGTGHHYSALDPELLRWVHITFTEALLGAHLIWGGPIPGGADAFVSQWARAGSIMGVTDPPTTTEELQRQLAGFNPMLCYDDRVGEAMHFLHRPPLPRLIGIAYPILYAGAVSSMPALYLDLLRLRKPRWPAITATRILLGTARVTLRPTAPGAAAAQARIKRLNEDG